MKKIISKVTVGLFLIAFVSGCSKQEEVFTENIEENSITPSLRVQVSTDGITVVNERLVFDNWTTFENTLRSLSALSFQELHQWEQNFPGFTSMLKTEELVNNFDICRPMPAYISEIMPLYSQPDSQNPSDCVIERPIYDLGAATVINGLGIIQIGTDVLKFEYEKVYILKDAEESEIPNIKEIRQTAPHRVDEKDIIRSSNTCFEYFTTSRRMKGNMQIVNTGLVNWANTRVVHEKKTWCCWKNEKNYLKIDASWGQMLYSGAPFTGSPAGTFNSGWQYTKEISKQIDLNVNISAPIYTNEPSLSVFSAALYGGPGAPVITCSDSF